MNKSQSVWTAIGNSLKTALLKAIKDVVTPRVAAMLMGLLVPAANVPLQQDGMGTGGIPGKLGGIPGVGAVPVFAGGAPGGAGSGAAAGGGLGSILPPIFGSGGNVLFPGAAAGHTPPFVPSSSGGRAGMGVALAAGEIFSKAGLAGMLPGLKSFFGDSGRTTGPIGAAGAWQPADGSAKTDRLAIVCRPLANRTPRSWLAACRRWMVCVAAATPAPRRPRRALR